MTAYSAPIQTERTFDEGLKYGTGLAANCTDEQAREELSVWHSLPYSLYTDGVITGISLALGARRNG